MATTAQPRPQKKTLSPVVRNALSALTAGAVTLISPARIPRGARRAVSMARTGTSVAALAGDRLPNAINAKLPAPASALFGRAQSAAPFAGAGAAGFALVTSAIGLKADRKVEELLTKRGVRHPRVVMAVGVVAVVFVVNTVRPRIQAAIADRAKGLAPHRGAPASN